MRIGPDKGFFIAELHGPTALFLFLNNELGFSMTADELTRLMEPTIERLGYELADLEVNLGGRGVVKRKFIDRADGIGFFRLVVAVCTSARSGGASIGRISTS